MTISINLKASTKEPQLADAYDGVLLVAYNEDKDGIEYDAFIYGEAMWIATSIKKMLDKNPKVREFLAALDST